MFTGTDSTMFACVLFFAISTTTLVSAGTNELNATFGCVCSGENVTYWCSVYGGDFTVWSGSIMADNCKIALSHAQFPSTTEYCNTRAIIGQGVSKVGDCYTSTLTFLATSELEGRTIECSVDNVVNVTTIGTTTLRFTRVPFPPPTALRLADAMSNELTFDWIQPAKNCPSLSYQFFTESCGVCPNMSSVTNITCIGFTLPGMCTFKIHSVICGNLLSSTPSNIVRVNLSVPGTPSLSGIVPYYSQTVGESNLLRLLIMFRTVDSFAISEDITGSATNYSVTLSNSANDMICGLVVIPSSSCTHGLCSYIFNASTSRCPQSTDMNITVFATNILGSGRTSNEISIDAINKFVNVKFVSSTRSIDCTFLNWELQGITTTKQCLFNITYGANCENQLNSYSSSGSSNSLSSGSINFLSTISEYCVTVRAISSDRTVVVEARLNLITTNEGIFDLSIQVDISIISLLFYLTYSGEDSSTIAIVVIFIVIAGLTTVTVVVIVLVVWVRQRRIPATIRFSNEHKPGSLAKILKVFKDHNVNILRINTPYLKRDLRGGLCVINKDKINFVHFCCTQEIKTTLSERLASQIEIESGAGYGNTSQLLFHAHLTVKDKPGALFDALCVFEELHINILGLNTRSQCETIPGYKNNYVSVLCSQEKLGDLVRDLEEYPGAIQIKTEFIDPTYRKLQFLVKNEVGALVTALKMFGKFNINIDGINSYTQPRNGQQRQCVECICEEQERPNLLHRLSLTCGCGGDEAPTGTETGSDTYIVKFSIRDEIGSLAAALQVFSDLHVDVIGLNMDPKKNYTETHSDYYLCIQIKFNTLLPDIEQGLIRELKVTRLVVDVTLEHDQDGMKTVSFGIRHEVGALLEALKVFSRFNVSISGIKEVPREPSHDQEIQVEYKRNYVYFQSTKEQEAKLEHKLQASGLAVDIKQF